jgi:hypothetical protein
MTGDNERTINTVEKYVTAEYGKRCKTTDLEDFPDLEGDANWGRCAACVAWEEFDRFKEWLLAHG